ncbi:MBL fold metallo-hydrolase [Methanosalsum natronophilum]|uniref:MBL fold metallo-hydrolase n=1 Tax=Methanosalsum natronophilum TaxID=768733 RepID=A0A3R7VYH8_9EURY|nr:MAG: MBL fold metallo-hydrolase [Methanosalsum natronophilum]
MDQNDNFSIKDIEINWFGNASFLIRTQEMNVYIDPYIIPKKINFEDKADLILITHSHKYHCEYTALQKLWKGDTTILMPEPCKELAIGDTRFVEPNDFLGEGLEVKGFEIQVFEAYNIKNNCQSKGTGVGYVINTGSCKLYHTGDTDSIPEMEFISADIVLLSVGNDSIMDVAEVVKLIDQINPKIVIPMNYDSAEKNAEILELKKCIEEMYQNINFIVLSPIIGKN